MRANKPKIITAVLGALLAGTALAAGGLIHTTGSPINTYPGKADKGYCTILIYMDGSNLESDYGAAAADLNEMQQAVAKADAGGKDVHVVVEAGGASEWQYEPMKNHDYGRFCITGQGVSDMEEVDRKNMGRFDTLADFINYGTQSYPAEHYGIIFWNHGSGQIQGFGSDENYNDSSLPLEEIKKGIEQSARREPFDFIGMDACLMSDIELVSVLQGKTDYLIASEELEPQDGYAYEWMEMLMSAAPGGEYGRQVGEAILSSYEAFYRERDFSVTLSLIDMNQYDLFHEAMDKILENISFQVPTDSSKQYEQIGKLRSSLLSFGSRGTDSMSEQVDIMDFFSLLAEEALYKPELYENLEKACQTLVLGKVWQGYDTPPSGISIFLPAGDNPMLKKDCNVYANLSFCPKYQSFVEKYKSYFIQKPNMYWEEPDLSQKELRMNFLPRQLDEIADAYRTIFFQENGVSYMLSADSDVTLDKSGCLITSTENTFWGLKDEILCFIETYDNEYTTEYAAPVLYRKAGDVWKECQIYAEFSEDNPDGVITQIIPCETGKQIYELEQLDEIIPLYPLYPDDVQSKEPEDSANIYKKNFYMGKRIKMENMAKGDGKLMKIKYENPDALCYGFLIRDTRMKLYYTSPTSSK